MTLAFFIDQYLIFDLINESWMLMSASASNFLPYYVFVDAYMMKILFHTNMLL